MRKSTQLLRSTRRHLVCDLSRPPAARHLATRASRAYLPQESNPRVAPAAGALTSMPRRLRGTIESRLSQDVPDEFEFFELPPELAWLQGAASLPGAVPPEEASIHDDDDRTVSATTPLHGFSGCPSAAAAAGFSRGGSRASTPESIAELEPPLRFASPTPAAGVSRDGSTRVFASARTERGARAKALAPGRSRVHDPWSWRD